MNRSYYFVLVRNTPSPQFCFFYKLNYNGNEAQNELVTMLSYCVQNDMVDNVWRTEVTLGEGSKFFN
jgi:hypothetical protein